MDVDPHLNETNSHLAAKPHYRVWWHQVVAWVAHALLWVVGRNFGNFWTTLGDTIYAPKGYLPAIVDDYDYTVVCHEIAHRYDDIEHGWWYRLSYLFSGKARARWEVRGYGMQLVAAYRIMGRVPESWVDRFSSAITGPEYLWAGDEDDVRASLESIKDAIDEIDTTSYHPSVLEGVV